MNRSVLFVSSFFALSAAIVACTGDDPKPAANSAPVVTSPAPSASSTAGSENNVSPVPTTTGSVPTPAPSATEEPPVANNDAGVPPIKPFDPSQLTGLALWLRGDSIDIDASDKLTTWHDKSGNGNDAIPLAGWVPPKKSGFKGNDAVQFAGLQALTIKDSASTEFSGDFTVVVVEASNQTAGTYGALFGKSAQGAPYYGPALFTNYPGGPSANMGAIGAQIDSVNFITSNETALDDSSVDIITFQRANDTIGVQVNAGTFATMTASKPGLTTAVGIDTYIGGHPNAAAQYFVGDIFEVIAFPSVLNKAQKTELLAYLAGRYK
jgi:hypothetical protein